MQTLGLKIGSSRCRNFIDMNAVYGGFAANLVAEPVWVMNVVPVFGAPNTLHAIYDRGLIGVLHDWYVCIKFENFRQSKVLEILRCSWVFVLLCSACHDWV